MKITFISPPPNLSGGARVIAIYADLLSDMGHDVTVVVQGHREPGKLRRVKDFLKGHRLKPRPTTNHFDSMKARSYMIDGSRTISDADVPDADVVIATFWTTAQTVASLSDRKGRKFYFVQHHEVHNPLFAEQAAATYQLPLKKIAVSGWIREAMREFYGDNDVQVVPNAVDHQQFSYFPRGKQDVPTVSLMYSRERFKGLDTSLKALELVQTQLPALRGLAFGMHEPVESLPLPDYISFTQFPPQDEIPRLYAASDLYLFGSRYEGFGLPVLEAMACGCPVIGTRTGCAPDVIEEGKTGYIVDVDDTEALAEAMIKVLKEDSVTWRSMSEHAARATERYSWADSARVFVKALES